MSSDSKGYITAIAGTLAGAIVLGGTCLGLIMLYLGIRVPAAGLESLPLILASIGTGIVTGAIIGCGLLLHYKMYAAAWKTAVTTGVLVIIGIVPVIYITNVIYNLSGIGGPVISLPLTIVLLLVASLLARRIWTGPAYRP